MTAAALLKHNPKPSDEEIEGAMSANLCRCATYLRIKAGVRRAAEIAVAAPVSRKKAAPAKGDA